MDLLSAPELSSLASLEGSQRAAQQQQQAQNRITPSPLGQLDQSGMGRITPQGGQSSIADMQQIMQLIAALSSAQQQPSVAPIQPFT